MLCCLPGFIWLDGRHGQTNVQFLNCSVPLHFLLSDHFLVRNIAKFHNHFGDLLWHFAACAWIEMSCKWVIKWYCLGILMSCVKLMPPFGKRLWALLCFGWSEESWLSLLWVTENFIVTIAKRRKFQGKATIQRKWGNLPPEKTSLNSCPHYATQMNVPLQSIQGPKILGKGVA